LIRSLGDDSVINEFSIRSGGKTFDSNVQFWDNSGGGGGSGSSEFSTSTSVTVGGEGGGRSGLGNLSL